MSYPEVATPARPAAAGRVLSPSLWLGVIVALGIALRLRQFLNNRSMWLDEASLALSFVRSLPSLLTEPLLALQSAPPLFIVLAKCAVLLFGYHDWALRLAAVLPSCLALLFAYVLAQRSLDGALSKVVFLLLMAISPVLVYYADEFKPYSLDACLSTALLAAMAVRNDRRAPLYLGLTGFFGLAASLPFIFLAAPAAAVLAVEYVKAGRLQRLASIALTWTAGFLLQVAYVLSAGVDRTVMIARWESHNAFPPDPMIGPAGFGWFGRSLIGLTQLSFRTAGVATPGSMALHADIVGAVVFVVFVLLFLLSLWKARVLVFVIVASIALCMLASVFRLYPFSSRLLIVFIPAVFWLCAYGLDVIRQHNWMPAALVAAFLVLVSSPSALQAAIQPREQSVGRQAIRQIARRLRPGDIVAVGINSMPAFRFYGNMLPFSPRIYVLALGAEASGLDQLLASSSGGRIWVLFTHKTNIAARHVRAAKGLPRPSFRWQGPSVFLRLYDITRSPTP